MACLRAKLADGRGVTVRARTYVLAAGAIASSYLLLRSGAGRGLPVGQGVLLQHGRPAHRRLRREPLRSFDGLQISHFGIPSQDGFVFETWFNPPVSQALNMPGWFEQHFENMQRYDHLMAVGVLVGTESNGRIIAALTGGPGVDFRPQPDDLADARARPPAARRAAVRRRRRARDGQLVGLRRVHVAERAGAIDQIAADPDYISLGTGHPQGGNALSRDPERGVVGPDFRVHGYDDLYVCDASVFPTSLTVNPQLTVMALAHYAAQRIEVEVVYDVTSRASWWSLAFYAALLMVIRRGRSRGSSRSSAARSSPSASAGRCRCSSPTTCSTRPAL